MNKKIMYTFIPAIAAIGALVGFKNSSAVTTYNNKVESINDFNNKAVNAIFNNDTNEKHKSACTGQHEALDEEDWTPISKTYLTADNNRFNLSSGNYYLTEDIDIKKVIDETTGADTIHGFVLEATQGNGSTVVNFCLNGHGIKGYPLSTTENAGPVPKSIFNIDANCTLNLYDCNGSSQKHYFVENDANNPDNNYWKPSTDNAVTPLSLDGGYLYCDNCIAIGNNGAFNMYGGSIVGCSKENTEAEFGTKQTIISTPKNAANTSIDIKNGNIVGCNANDIIFGGKGSTITVSGGEIKKSYAKESIIYNTSKTEMTGGKIHNCYTGDGENTNAVLLNAESSEAVIADTAEITDNITLLNRDILLSRYIGGSVVTYDKSTTIKLGGTAKVIRNRTSTDMDSEHTYAKKIETTELANIVINHQSAPSDNQPVITPIIGDDPHALKKGARFGVRTLNEGAQAYGGYEFTIVTSDTSYKQFFFSDNSKMIVAEVQFPALHHLQLTGVNSIDINAQITKKDEMPSSSGKPTLDNAILLKGKLDKSIEVVIRDKEDLGEIKETVETNIKKELTSQSHLISQFDISLESDGVEIENIDGNKYGVTLKLPNSYSSLKKQKVIYIKDDGSIETKDTTVTGNKCYFETDHFSTWGFAAEGKLGAALSGGAIAGIVLGTAAGGGGIFFVVFIIFFKKKLRFFVNGYKVYEERLKRNEDIDFTNSNVAGKQWYSDKKCTKPFTKTKMGLLNKSVYTHSDDTYGGNKDDSTQVDTNKDNLITSLKNKVTSLFKKKNKETSEEQNNVTQEEQPNTVPEEQNNNNDIKQD